MWDGGGLGLLLIMLVRINGKKKLCHQRWDDREGTRELLATKETWLKKARFIISGDTTGQV